MKAFYPALSMCDLIFSGVFERHPRLRLAIVEFELAWAPHLLSTMVEAELAGVVADDPDICLAEAVLRVGLDLQRQPYLRAFAALQFHHYRVEDGVERFHRPNPSAISRWTSRWTSW
jgi:hypothetical protein